jgi:ribose 5-phosphate isomerase A
MADAPLARHPPAAGSDPADALRRAAARRAVDWVRDGMVLGLGTGRTVGHAIEFLAVRAREGLRITGVPSSRATEAKATALGLALVTLEQCPELDLTIDGADEVDPRLRLLKGGGGALLREKVLAAASRQLLIAVDESKLVPRLGATRGVPLEVLPFAYVPCARQLERLGGTPQLRRGPGGEPAVTDNGNWLIDCAFPPEQMGDPAALDAALHRIPGLLETGLFWSFRPIVVVADAAGVHVLGT